jgi:MFS family permease
MALLLLMGVGWGFIVVNNMTNSLVQTLVEDELRGRVMGLYTLTFFGMAPLGSMLVGFTASRLSEPVTLMITAGIMFGYALIVLTAFPKIRRLH